MSREEHVGHAFRFVLEINFHEVTALGQEVR